MRKTSIFGLCLIATMSLHAEAEQMESSQVLHQRIDTAKLSKCPEFTSVAEHVKFNEKDTVIRIESENVETKTLKEGSTVTIEGCLDGNNIDLKIKNIHYWIK